MNLCHGSQTQGLAGRKLLNRRVAKPKPRTVPLTVNSQQLDENVDSSPEQANSAAPSHRINLLPHSQWEDGIPPVMGAHLMASGIVSPVSISKGPGRTPESFKFYYPDGNVDVAVMQFVTNTAASKGLAQTVADASAAAIKKKGSFTIVLSGGSLLKSLVPLAQRKDVDFSKWHVFWVDERDVPHESEDSNYGAAKEQFLSKVRIPASQIYAMAEGLPVRDAAINYAGRLMGLDKTLLPRTEDDLPVFDMILLGIGPDGHVASLFPNRSQLTDNSSWVLPVENSPKPPPERITFSLPAINSAVDIVFVATGASKTEIVQRVLETQSLPGALPAQLVRPSAGKITWILDVESANDLHVTDWTVGKKFPRNVV